MRPVPHGVRTEPAALAILYVQRDQLGDRPARQTASLAGLAGYRSLLGSGRGRRTYSYVLVNSTFHSGPYTWFGLYFVERYDLGEVGIAPAILGYGIPGFVFGTTIGRAADRHGRGRILPLGLAVAAVGAPALVPTTTVVVAASCRRCSSARARWTTGGGRSGWRWR
ncbi:MFS transporter (plasmid) [Iamia sp. SCSIO 61187]|uniref:hypothetical protein n=1 Tax=Iamia sp. SCSIO 61187 TaxID=2722752 RepID=UPI001C635578|nr:hypothetical protein [Iamia sp. SCSIO 61187]QYG94320.1 MFS transporter [Iamia sp. SCSIO 61187]QYG95790.1 MFS transporter [Iamia sp. SCSIO 61187]